ncbi:MAG: isopeptide-forming domain-containing fimbrial protein [Dehalococcoidia bacterium]
MAVLIALAMLVLRGASPAPVALAAPPPLPVATPVAPVEPFYNEQFAMTVAFDNASAGDVGYGPFIEMEFPPAVSFDAATYLGVPVAIAFNAVCPTAGPSANTFTNPLTGAVRPCAGGNQVVVLELPFGSFTPGQPAAVIDVAARVTGSDPSVVGVAQAISALGGFRFGDTPTGSTPIYQAPANTASVTPAILRLRKVYVGPEDETATGPNFPRQHRVIADIADGQTLNSFALTDRLPNNLAFLSATAVSPGGGSVGTAPAVGVPSNAPNNQVIGSWASVTGTAGATDAVLEVNFFVPLNDADGNSVINAASGDDATSVNDAAASGVWTATSGVVTSDVTAADHILTDKSIAIQKSVANLTDGDNSPGDVLEYTIQVQVSDFFAFANLVVTDVYGDGQLFDGTFTPTLAWSSHAGLSAAAAGFAGPNFTHTAPTMGTPVGTLTFDVSAEIVAGSGQLVGGCVPPSGVMVPDCSTYNDGPTTATIVFRTIIQEAFVGPVADVSVDQGDVIQNSVTVTGDVLDVTDLSTVNGTEADSSASSISIAVGSIEKALTSINGTPVLPGQRVTPGDTVTYRLRYTLPTSDFEDLILTDFLPLPVFDGAEVTASVASTATPPAGRWAFGPGNTFTAVAPSFTANASPVNTLVWDFGDWDDGTNAPRVIEIFFTVTVRDDPFADGLFLTNQARGTEKSTFNQPSQADAIVQVQLGEPNLVIRTGIVAKTNLNATFSAGTCNATVPVTGISLGRLDCSLANADAGDTVTFVMTVQNSGNAEAYNSVLRAVLPAGLTFGSLVSVTDGDGNPLANTGSLTTGLTLTAPVPGATTGDNTDVVLVTFTATIPSSVTPDQVLTTNGQITEFRGSPTGANHLSSPRQDPATITVAPAAIAKSFVTTSASHTTGTTVVIGERVTYDLTVTVPEGTLPNAVITDQLAPGLAFVEWLQTDYNGPTTVGPCPSPIVVSNQGQTVTFNLCTLENLDTDDTVTETVVIRYVAVVLNVPGNDRGVSRNNSATLAFTGGSEGPVSVAVTIAEPQLQLSSGFSPAIPAIGDTVTITLTLSHTAASDADALNAVLTDIMPFGLSYVPGTVSCTGGATACTIAGAAIDAVWPVIPDGATVTMSFDVVVGAAAINGGQIFSTIVEWTSLPGDPGQISTHHPLAYERTGDQGDPGAAENDYRIQVVPDAEAGPPETYLGIVPPAVGNDNTPTFTYFGIDPPISSGIVSFICRLNNVVIPCPNVGPDGTITLGPLADGKYTFSAAAVDNDGNVDPTPAVYAFLIDTVKPSVTAKVIDGATGQPYVPGSWVRGPVQVSFTCADNAGGSGIKKRGTNPPDTAPPDIGNTYPTLGDPDTPPVAFGASREGKTTLTLDPKWRCVDEAGNLAPPPPGFPLVVQIDKTRPTCKVIFGAKSARIGQTLAIQLKTTSSDTISGVFKTVLKDIYRFDGTTDTSSKPVSPVLATGFTIGGNIPQTVSFPGAKNRGWVATYEVFDRAGNSNTCKATLRSR